jgi:hypothetical protein
LEGDEPDPVLVVNPDLKDLTPLSAVQKAVKEMREGHTWTVKHKPSGLMWSVDLESGKVTEIDEREYAELTVQYYPEDYEDDPPEQQT